MRCDFCTGAVGFKRPFEGVTLSWPPQMTVQECGQQTVGTVLWRTRHRGSHGRHKVFRAFIKGPGGVPGCQSVHRVWPVPDNRVGDKGLKSRLSGLM